MLIGSKSTDTILDVFKVGFHELMREVGLPEEIRFNTRGIEIIAKAPNLSKRIDQFRINFTYRADVDAEQIVAASQKLPFAVLVQPHNGSCTITLPGFEWRHVAHLAPVHTLLEQFASHSLTSQSWEVKVISFVSQGFNINRLIEEMKARNASDLHLRAGSPPYLRIDNDLIALDMPVITAADMEELSLQLGNQDELDLLMKERETSWNFHAAGIGYLRVSGYFKQGAIALAIRLIPEQPLAFEQLNIPMIIRNIADSHRGLFLVCGITGSGKSTTLASLLDYVNQTRSTNIITVEDPIEFVYQGKKSIVSQRQIGKDTHSFGNALRGALREDPDVILVGEMRDMETIRAAIGAAETGHLVFSTMHTMTAVDTIGRIISYFPHGERDLIRQELAYCLRGVVCQRLLRKKGGGRIPCVEILLGGSPIVRDSILESQIDKLAGVIETDTDMKSFDQHAVELFQAGLVTKEEALTACSNIEAFDRHISGIKSSEGRKLLK